MSDTTNENIIGMQEEVNKVKSFIVSVNGEGITIDYLVKYPSDYEVLDAMINKVKSQCNINETNKPQP